MGYQKSYQDETQDSLLELVEHFWLFSFFITIFFAVLTAILVKYIYVLNSFPSSEFMSYILWLFDLLPVWAAAMTFFFAHKTFKAFLHKHRM